MTDSTARDARDPGSSEQVAQAGLSVEGAREHNGTTTETILMHRQAHIHNPYPETMPYQLLADSGMVHVVPSRTLKVLGCESIALSSLRTNFLRSLLVAQSTT